VPQAKGTNLIDMVKFLRSQKEAARTALPPALHGYLERRIVVSDWYPEEEMYALMLALGKVMPGSGDELFRQIGVLNARNHLNGSYRHLLSELRLETLPIRAAALWKSLHDTGELLVEIEGAGAGRTVLRGYVNPGPEMCLVIDAYVAEVLRLTGLDRVRSETECCVHRGAAECRWRFRGDPRAPR
jgi:hypothetical protein